MRSSRGAFKVTLAINTRKDTTQPTTRQTDSRPSVIRQPVMESVSQVSVFLLFLIFGQVFGQTTEEYDFYETTDLTFLSECLNVHNKFRQPHQAPGMKLDPELIEFARQRAITIAISDGSAFYHPDNLTVGENLAWNSELDIPCQVPLQLWYNELPLYNYQRPNINPNNGHFTQMVWKESIRLGCGQAVSYGPLGGTYTVCNYAPPGNVLGDEKDNIKPKRGAKKPQKGKPKNKKTTPKPQKKRVQDIR